MTTVACVGGRRTVEVLAELGVRTVLVDDEIPIEYAFLADVPIEVDLEDWEQVERALRPVHEATPLDAVLSTRDSYVPLAAFLAARLRVRGLALSAALSCRDKGRTRRVLAGAGVRVPRWAEAAEAEDAARAAADIGWPVVVKRRQGSGGGGVRLCADAASVAAAATELAAEGAGLLVEQYVDGPELAVQTVTTEGRTEVLNVLRQHVGPPPRFAELGYDFPSGLDAAQEAVVSGCVRAALEAIGFDVGVAHVQVRLGADGPVVIEINPRPPGGRLGTLTETVSGVDPVRAAIEVTLGRPVTRHEPQAAAARYRCITFPSAGLVSYRLEAEQGLLPPLEGELEPVVELDVNRGDVVLPVEHPDGGVYGRVVVFGADAGQVARDCDAVMAALDLHVDPMPGVEEVTWRP